MLFHQNCETLFPVFSTTVTIHSVTSNALRDAQKSCFAYLTAMTAIPSSVASTLSKSSTLFRFLSTAPIFYIIIYSHFFKISLSFFTSSGFAICPFIPAFFAICTSSAKAFAVMATIGSCPRSPDNPRIAAVAS